MRFKIGFLLPFLLIFIVVIMTSFIPVKIPENEITTNKELLSAVFSSIDNLKTVRYNLQCNERIKGRMQHTESRVKLQVAPRKLYLYIKGIELLWSEGKNNGNALVNPGSFPYINLNLDPYGSLMRKDQHHTIHEMGYHYLEDVLKDGIRRVGDKFDKSFIFLGEEDFNGRPCYKLSVSFHDFAWIPYTVSKGETLVTIARKLRVSEYMVLENNPQLSSYTDVKANSVIKVPNAYSKLTLLLIDKEYLLPVNNKVFDDRGLFETYEYYDMRVNQPIDAIEFTREFKGYKF